MKLFLKRLQLLQLLALIFLFQCQKSEKISSAAQQTNTSEPAVNEMPSMEVILLNGSKKNMKDVNEDVVIILFQPDCDHCQREATQIQERLRVFDDYSLYFISSSSLGEIEKFSTDYKLNGPQIHFAQTTVESILSNFGSIPAPSLYIYRKKKLVKKFNGETNIEEVLKFL